jgi:nucleolin
MAARLYIGNLSRSTVQDELSALFAQAGRVLSVEVIKERKSGESMGFGFVTMSTLIEADRAVSMFNLFLFGGHTLNVSLARSGENRDVMFPQVE